jgi:hypothetical protein
MTCPQSVNFVNPLGTNNLIYFPGENTDKLKYTSLILYFRRQLVTFLKNLATFLSLNWSLNKFTVLPLSIYQLFENTSRFFEAKLPRKRWSICFQKAGKINFKKSVN